MVLDKWGNMYINDSYNFRIRKVDANGIITTIAGDGTSAFSGDGSAAANAQLNANYLVIDTAGNLYFNDRDRIRKISVGGIISTIAGNAFVTFRGDTISKFNTGLLPSAIAVNQSGTVFIADGFRSRILKINSDTSVTTFAGGGTNFGDDVQVLDAVIAPGFVAFDPSGNLWLTETGNNRI